jgi:hypothetical protein
MLTKGDWEPQIGVEYPLWPLQLEEEGLEMSQTSKRLRWRRSRGWRGGK